MIFSTDSEKTFDKVEQSFVANKTKKPLFKLEI